MSKEIVLQSTYSRNSHDMTLLKTVDGRNVFAANKKGVAFRIGVIVNYLAKNPNSSAAEITEHLKEIHRSYNTNDVSQPIKQMRTLGMIKSKGFGPGTTYQLTPQGRKIWQTVTKKWTGK